MVQSCIGRDDKAGLSEYIEIYKTELPPDIREIYCRSQAVNALICCYASQVRRHKNRFEAQAAYPEQCPVPDTEVTVLLGNLLENAVEACLREKNGKCSIRLRIFRKNKSSLVFLTDNTCSGTVRFDADGKTPLSSKRKGVGIGVSSIREIADRYGGDTLFEQKAGMFYASVWLRLPEEVDSRP